jgi:CubicO group peptidase (beta-lactamase class C family)
MTPFWRRLGAFALACALTLPIAAAEVDRAALVAALDARMAESVKDGFNGSVLVADGSDILFERQYGFTDPGDPVDITADSAFNNASSGKLYTSVATLQLVQQGKLDLDAPIGRYLPDWPVKRVRDEVTARQLLLHTSGLGQFWGEEFQRLRPQLQDLKDYLPLLDDEPVFAPGSQWAYSSNGYMLLGLLIEAISGENYYDYVRKHVFDVAGMRGAGYFAIDGKAAGVAVPYVIEDDSFSRLNMPEPRGGPAGGGFARPRDWLAFHRALTGGKLLDSATLDLMFTAVTLPPGTRAPPQGLGTVRFAAGDDVGYGHPGGAPGVAVDFRAARSSGWAIVVMSNRDGTPVMPLTTALAGIVAEHGGADLRVPMPQRR